MTTDRFDFRFRDPDQMPVAMGAVATNFSIHPLGHDPFRADVHGARLRDVGLFRIGITKSEVVSDEQLGYFSVTIALRDLFEAQVGRETERFADSIAHFAHPEDAFRLRMPRPGEALVMNVFRERFDEYDRARRGGAGEGRSTLPSRLQLLHPAGRTFRRFLSFLWAETQSDSPLLESERAVTELEDALLESLLLASDHEQLGLTEFGLEARWRRAVDFIMANLDGPLSVGTHRRRHGHTLPHPAAGVSGPRRRRRDGVRARLSAGSGPREAARV